MQVSGSHQNPGPCCAQRADSRALAQPHHGRAVCGCPPLSPAELWEGLLPSPLFRFSLPDFLPCGTLQRAALSLAASSSSWDKRVREAPEMGGMGLYNSILKVTPMVFVVYSLKMCQHIQPTSEEKGVTQAKTPGSGESVGILKKLLFWVHF